MRRDTFPSACVRGSANLVSRRHLLLKSSSEQALNLPIDTSVRVALIHSCEMQLNRLHRSSAETDRVADIGGMEQDLDEVLD